MMLFDSEGKIRRYESPEAILEEFAILRLEYYHKRKLSLLAVRSLPPLGLTLTADPHEYVFNVVLMYTVSLSLLFPTCRPLR